jgi:hypothetical protein
LYRIDDLSVRLLLLRFVFAALCRRRDVPGLDSNKITKLTHNTLHLLVDFSKGRRDDDEEEARESA